MDRLLRSEGEEFWKRDLKAKETREEKLQYLQEKRSFFDELQQHLKKTEGEGRENINLYSERGELREMSVSDAQKRLDQQVVAFDKVALDFYKQQQGFFEKLLTNFKNWFNRTFDFHKTGDLQRKAAELPQKLKKLEMPTEALDQIANIKQQVDELKERQGEGMLPEHVKEFQRDKEQVQKDLEALKKQNPMFDDIAPMVKEMNETFNRMQDVATERYKGEYNTLYEKLRDHYNDVLRGDPTQAYQILELKPDASLEAVQDKQSLATTDQQKTAYAILSDPVRKATYDAFLKDYQMLNDAQMSTHQLTKHSQQLLKEQGALNGIEITKSTHDTLQKNIQQVKEPLEKITNAVNTLQEGLEGVALD